MTMCGLEIKCRDTKAMLKKVICSFNKIVILNAIKSEPDNYIILCFNRYMSVWVYWWIDGPTILSP